MLEVVQTGQGVGKDEILRTLKEDGYLTEDEIVEMAGTVLRFRGSREDLEEAMRRVAEGSDKFECVRVECPDDQTCMYRFWQVANILGEVESRDLERFLSVG